ncbi:hypothetical protein BDN70DRAFT_689603 [Pholiota conissans]|uniref:Uncharacterized protein n=1 Tax=Pholiota conissans TaxID=109636 RepID=A0A9P5YKZ9_9AGAR|nr:hypothetical protein BDN70DRAFT_689603 [Pholiota conissans]
MVALASLSSTNERMPQTSRSGYVALLTSKSSGYTAAFQLFPLVGPASVFQLANIRSRYASPFLLFDFSSFDSRDCYQISTRKQCFACFTTFCGLLLWMDTLYSPLSF